MKRLEWLIKKAAHSRIYLGLLNMLLHRMVPFNKPHGLRVTGFSLDENGFMSEVQVMLPYRKVNMNHIRGTHAGGLVTLCEYTSGLPILFNISSDEYRIILSRICIDYHYQAKSDVTAVFSLTKEWIEKEIRTPLKKEEKILVEVPVKVFDVSGNHVCTGMITWQIKNWKNVKTKF